VNAVTTALAVLLRRLLVVVPSERRDWAEAVVSETVDVPDGRARLSWLLGAGRLIIREVVMSRTLARTISFAGYLGTGVAAVWAVVVVTGGVTYVPLRRAMIVLAVVLAAVFLLGWVPRVFGPVADGAAAGTVRAMGFVLAGLAVWGVVVEFWFNRDPSTVNPGVVERASTGTPAMTVLFAIYLAGFLAATRHGSPLRGTDLLRGIGFAIAAVAVWFGGAILLPSASAAIGVAVMAAAGIGAAASGRGNDELSRPALAGLLSATMTAQIVMSVADIMFHLGPDTWIPDAGPGPLTPQARLEQNRIEAIDPYTLVLLLGAVVALTLVIVALRRRAPASTEVTPAIASAPTPRS
jgi:hypothetical protein